MHAEGIFIQKEESVDVKITLMFSLNPAHFVVLWRKVTSCLVWGIEWLDPTQVQWSPEESWLLMEPGSGYTI